ncbi:bifunctional DNA-formamidopyrimidine glycosylase/DNA-(apurinic or apyrimidinic site) lyase [Pyruvatibacter mobilis]|uniref:bifunctional DNA-formamidopyrimidine glycosylase/DNA-(apurinic or apyrimidinic site) lyase n=1 Tax=Pyruvatibacter mobilis TaxID=1712261 RepID=UPI003BAB9816
MPELPEVETVRRGIAPAMEGRRFLHVEAKRPDLRFPLPEGFTRRLEGQALESLARRGKYLVGRLTDGALLIMHLGMSGRFVVEMPQSAGSGDDMPAARPAARPGAFHLDTGANAHALHEHIIFRMEGGGVVRYSDPRRFGFMTIEETGDEGQNQFLRVLGPEPLEKAFKPSVLAAGLHKRKSPIKTALLDQAVVAGLGNIYVCEALFRSGISPKRVAATLVKQSGEPTDRLKKLHKAIREVLAEAIEAGGSSLRDHAQADGSLGYFQHTFRVYDREGMPCTTLGCDTDIRRITQSGRSTFYCGKCQR